MDHPGAAAVGPPGHTAVTLDGKISSSKAPGRVDSLALNRTTMEVVVRTSRFRIELSAPSLSVCATLALGGCGSDPVEQATVDPDLLVPVEIVRDGSAGIEAQAGEITKEPLSVRVTSALGSGAPNVAVLWELQTGVAGEICLSARGECEPGLRSTYTDGVGQAQVWFRLTEIDSASVTARVVGIQNQVWFFLGSFED